MKKVENHWSTIARTRPTVSSLNHMAGHRAARTWKRWSLWPVWRTRKPNLLPHRKPLEMPRRKVLSSQKKGKCPDARNEDKTKDEAVSMNCDPKDLLILGTRKLMSR